nr:hypothetical protein HK105_007634 [Polyrhizophydium stewartii]
MPKDADAPHDTRTFFRLSRRKPATAAAPAAGTARDPAAGSLFAQRGDGLDEYERHKRLVADQARFYGPGSRSAAGADHAAKHSGAGRSSEHSRPPTDYDILKQHHRFLRSAEDDADSSWESRLAKGYYDRLFREFCLADLSRYAEGRIAMRWRTRAEVIDGKGQSICGNLACSLRDNLRAWEVNFAYVEAGQSRNALVKLTLCPVCSVKLNYRRNLERKAAAAKEPALDGGSERGSGSGSDGASRSDRRRHAASARSRKSKSHRSSRSRSPRATKSADPDPKRRSRKHKKHRNHSD